MKNLAYCTSRVQMDLQDFSTHNLARMSQYAIQFYKEKLGFKTDKSIEVAYLTMNSVNNAPMPSDYEYYTKVGINIGGQIFTLSVNNDMVLNRKMECGEIVGDSEGALAITTDPIGYEYGYFWGGHYRSGQYVGEFYSLPGGFNELGYFKEDWKRRQFQFYNVPRVEIILEYVADKDATITSLIPFSAVDACVQYIHHQLLTYDRSVPMNEKQLAQMRFNKAWAEYIYIANAPTIQDYLDENWASRTSSPKR